VNAGTARYVGRVIRYRFLDAMGDVIDEGDLIDHAAALASAAHPDEHEDDVERVEYLGPEGDWLWAGPLPG
jgi:hypothetical protein